MQSFVLPAPMKMPNPCWHGKWTLNNDEGDENQSKSKNFTQLQRQMTSEPVWDHWKNQYLLILIFSLSTYIEPLEGRSEEVSFGKIWYIWIQRLLLQLYIKKNTNFTSIFGTYKLGNTRNLTFQCGKCFNRGREQSQERIQASSVCCGILNSQRNFHVKIHPNKCWW